MKNKKLAKSYNAYAEKWSKRLRTGENYAHEYLEKPAMYKKLQNLKNKTVLCLGCGSGEECAYLKSLGAKKVVGVDLSKKLIEVAKKSYPDIEFYVMNIEKLELPKDNFDLIYSSLVMHYLKKWDKVLDSVFNVLKNNGTFLFSTHSSIRWGAEKIKNKNGNTSTLLGYIKNNKKKEFEIFGDYLNTRKVKDIWFNEFEVSYYHRSFSSIMKDIIKSKFKIIDFLEPKPLNSIKKKMPVFWGIHQKIPLFMIFELRKQ